MKRPVLLFIIGGLLIAGGIAAYFFKHQTIQVIVISYSNSFCTQDTPTSNCNRYDVRVKLPDGSQRTLVAPGFSNGNETAYDEVKSKIVGSKQHQAPISLVVDRSNRIIKAP